jgi:hypothetical protein
MAFLHHTPPAFSILVMELATGVEVSEGDWGWSLLRLLALSCAL